MKKRIYASLIIVGLSVTTIGSAQTSYSLTPLTSFGNRGDGSIQPGDSIGTSPLTGNDAVIGAPGGFGIQPGDLAYTSPTGPTNGYNIRGITWDAVTGKLVLVDTHLGQAGGATLASNAAIYVLDPDSGQIIGALNTNGIAGGSYTHVVAGVADDGVL